MQIDIFTDNYKIVDSGTVLLFNGNSDMKIELLTDSNFKFSIIIQFINDNQQNRALKKEVMENTIIFKQPMKWVNDWPVIGIDKDGDGCGEPVMTYKKPNVGKTYPICTPQESDEFDGYTLSPQWQWHANINEKWAYYAGDQSIVRLYSYPVVKEYSNTYSVKVQ